MSTVVLNMGTSTTLPTRTRLHLTRRGRAVFTTLAAVPIAIGALIFALNGGTAAAGDGAAGASFDYVTVQSGESLWQLAESLAPSADPREVIADIVNLNQLASAEIEPGQQLAIPAEYSQQ
jgi:LysM repeat protein